MSSALSERLLDFARALNRANNFPDLLDVVRAEVAASAGFEHVWLAVMDEPGASTFRLLDVSSARRDELFERAPTIPVDGDAMVAECLLGLKPVVVEDARTDPRTNKAVVAALGNRSIVNLPLVVLDKPAGALGLGTFGDEGCRVPTPAQLAHLQRVADLLTIAASRVSFVEQARVNERERRALEARVAQMQRLETVGEFAGGVAHDFNNLLTVILASAELARDATTDAARALELDAVAEAAERGRALTRQLLAMSRAVPLSAETLSVNHRVASLIPLLRRVIPESIQIDLIPSRGDDRVEADPTQFDQVVMNLCLNARDAMASGGRLTIEVEHVRVNGSYTATHPWASPGRYALVTVSDTGVGMTPEVAARVFEPFFTTKGPRAGTGLGLSVAHGIVRRHGGMLHCYSEPGVGTTFKVYWPITERDATQVGPKLEGAIRGGTERLLVAEDDLAVSAVARRILEANGYRVTVVNNHEAACAVVAREAFDLALLDVVMPGRTVPEVLEAFQAARPQMQVLLTSGYTADGNVARLVRSASLQLLTKPYDPDQLLRAVRARLDRR